MNNIGLTIAINVMSPFLIRLILIPNKFNTINAFPLQKVALLPVLLTNAPIVKKACT